MRHRAREQRIDEDERVPHGPGPIDSCGNQPARSQARAMTPAATNTLDRRRDLDGLRGVAVLMTVFLHYVARGGFVSPPSFAPLARLLDSFWSGVDIFFVLSGFLIGGIILDNGRAQNFWQAFYVRRALRILPVALLAIAFSYALLPALPPSVLAKVSVPPYAYLLFINNFWTSAGGVAYPALGPMWSLAIEQQYYLIAPAFMLFAAPRIRNIALLAIVLISPLLRIWHPGFSGWDFTLFRLDGFAAGMLVAVLVRDPRFAQPGVRSRKTIRIVAATLVAAAAAFGTSTVKEKVALGVSLNSLATAGAIVYLHFNRGSSLSAALSWRGLVTMGKYSYFIYLMHVPLLVLMLLLPAVPWVWKPVLAFGACLPAAAASWRFIESPLMRLAKRCTYAAAPGVTASELISPRESVPPIYRSERLP